MNLIHSKDEDISAVIVVKSKKTGEDHTYKIIANNRLSNRRFSVYMEVTYNNFEYIHTCYNIYAEPKFISGKVARGGLWLLKAFINKKINKVLEDASLYHTGRCIKCNRVLTDATSIEYGMGPECRSK
jgi:hypothetical protein